MFSENEVNEYLEKFSSSFSKLNPPEVNPGVTGLSQMIDHTILKPEASHNEIDNLCHEALKYNFKSVCVNSSYVERCSSILKGTGIKVCSVIGFPLGSMATEIKVYETKFAVEKGSSEVDMVINIGELKSNNFDYVLNDIRSVVNAAHSGDALLKVIIETCLLSDYEKIAVSLLVKESGADFIKTSTGFSKAGADIRDVALMKFTAGDMVKIKASGGIRSLEDALKMIAYGADRLGTSSGVKIVEAYKNSYTF